jgi:hypothetical protein
MRATTLSLALLALCACTPRGDQQAAVDATADAAPATDAAPTSTHAFNDAIDAGDFAEHVKSRCWPPTNSVAAAPALPGEEKTVEYIKRSSNASGCKPGNGEQTGSRPCRWWKPRPTKRRRRWRRSARTQTLKFGTDMVSARAPASPR